MQQSLMGGRSAIELGVDMVLYGRWVALIHARVLRVPPHVASEACPQSLPAWASTQTQNILAAF
jgi:hypothetical protein